MAFLSTTRLKQSFLAAIRGLRVAFSHEQNFRIEVAAVFLVLVAIFIFPVSKGEIALLVVLLAFILVLELFNTAMEQLIDLLKPRLSLHAGEVKDIMAGALLVAAVAAVISGLVIFLPHFITLWQ